MFVMHQQQQQQQYIMHFQIAMNSLESALLPNFPWICVCVCEYVYRRNIWANDQVIAINCINLWWISSHMQAAYIRCMDTRART